MKRVALGFLLLPIIVIASANAFGGDEWAWEFGWMEISSLQFANRLCRCWTNLHGSTPNKRFTTLGTVKVSYLG